MNKFTAHYMDNVKCTSVRLCKLKKFEFLTMDMTFRLDIDS